MWSRKVIKESARGRLKVNYWRMVLVGLILAFVAAGGSVTSFDYSNYSQDIEEINEEILQGAEDVIERGLTMVYYEIMAGHGFFFVVIVLIVLAIAILLKIFVLNPLQIGCFNFFYKNIKEAAELKELSVSFAHGFLNKVKTMFFRDLFVALWSLLLIIPGIIKIYEYRMIPYLLAEDPSLSSKEAFVISKRMMTGNKWKAFVFDLSFIGWIFLSGLTLGILGVFYVNPYIYQAEAMLYDAIKFDDGFQPRNSEPVVEPIVDEMI